MGSGSASKSNLGDTVIFANQSTLSKSDTWKSQEEFEEAADKISGFFHVPEEVLNELAVLGKISPKDFSLAREYDNSGSQLPANLSRIDKVLNKRLSSGKGVALPKGITVSLKGIKSNVTVGETVDVNNILRNSRGTLITSNQISGSKKGAIIYKLSVPYGYKKGIMTRSTLADYTTKRSSKTGEIEYESSKKATIGGKYIMSNTFKGKVTAVVKAPSGATIVYVKVDG